MVVGEFETEPLHERCADLEMAQQKVRSSSRLRRSQPVTSSLHLLELHEPQAGTTLASVYRPPRESANTQSRCIGELVFAQYAQPPHATFRAVHCSMERSCSTRSMRRLRRFAALALRLLLTAITRRYVSAELIRVTLQQPERTP